jgi:superfamily II DNA helicase RecQ
MAGKAGALRSLGLEGFRRRQEAFIDEILAPAGCADRIFCLPTAYGKSLLYLVPTLAVKGVALVISPLVSLILDQCNKLNRAGPKLGYNLSSSCDADTPDEDLAFAAGGHAPMLLFCTPEKAASAGFQAKLRALHERRPLSFFVLDEAHLIEQGFNFRADYLKLDFLRRQFPEVPILCFSATCSPFAQAQLRRTLLLRDPVVVTERDHKSNMHLSVHYASKRSSGCSCGHALCSWGPGAEFMHAHLRAQLAGARGGSTLVATNSKKDCERLYEDARAMFPDKVVGVYHGSQPDDVRVEVQGRFIRCEIDILCATWASFGTGVDMPALSRVVLFGVPLSVYTFIQTIGRGGRAGQEYYVDAYVTEGDVAKQRAVLKSEVAKLQSAKKYAAYLQRSFDLMQAVVSTAVAGKKCVARFVDGLMYEPPQVLNVRFADLARFKAVNNRLPAGDRARWNSERRAWVLDPGSFHASLAPFGAVAGRPLGRCEKCSSCVRHCGGVLSINGGKGVVGVHCGGFGGSTLGCDRNRMP